MKAYRFALVLSAFVLGACRQTPPPSAELGDGDQVEVLKVIKGDEVEVQKGAARARVRLLGIHAFSAVLNDPQVEALSAGGISALRELTVGKKATLSFEKPGQKDASGRYLAYLTVDERDVGERAIEEGWAVVYTEYPFQRERAYLSKEAPAREGGKNLWGLQPAAELVRGLRRQWAEARRADGAAAFVDPLLTP